MEIDKPTLELLNEMGFVEDKTRKKLYYHKVDKFAHIDFREGNGKCWAKIGTGYVNSPEVYEKVPILKDFKERRDEIQNENQKP